MNRCQKNNNPGNLRFAGEREAPGKDDKGFAVFPNAPAGFRAPHDQIAADGQRGLTMAQFIARYAPPSKNNTCNYVNFVCTQLRCKDDARLSELSKYTVAAVIAQMEGYFREDA